MTEAFRAVRELKEHYEVNGLDKSSWDHDWDLKTLIQLEKRIKEAKQVLRNSKKRKEFLKRKALEEIKRC